MQIPCTYSCFSLSRFNNLYSNPIRSFLSYFSSVSSLNRPHTHISPPISNPIILNYLIQTFGFSEPRASSISNRFQRTQTPEKPQSVVQFLKQLGICDAHIRSAVRDAPQILFSDIDKTLKPKLQFFQEMGLTGSDLGKIISNNSSLLTSSLDRKLKPCIELFKKILTNDDKNHDLVLVLRRCRWITTSKEPVSKLLCNISFLEGCGIVGPQLSMLLKRQPCLFIMKESVLRDLVSGVVDMGFSIGSRMLVHAIYTVSCMSSKTFARKFELLKSFGFSTDECMEMFRRAPGLLRTSVDKLKIGIEFFMNIIRLEKSVLVHRPSCLMSSMEERVIPRYRVLQIMKSKRLLKKEPSFLNVLSLPEEEFLEKFISRFRDDAEELLVAYMGDFLDSSEE